jgi:hypothetical protein
VRKAVAVLVALVAATMLWTSLRPGTPARTYDAYELKAKDTAESVLSSVETARLVARVGTDGGAFGPYVSVSLSEAETAVDGAAASFAGLQPPDARADRLRTRLTAITDEAHDIVSGLRIDARRGQLDGLTRTARPLAGVSARLERFIAQHGG